MGERVTKGNPPWEQFEHEVQELLGLRSTPGSGNQWHDPSDGRSRPEDLYKLMVDCKHTESRLYQLNSRTLLGWLRKATGMGYHFAMPIRLSGMEGTDREKDWVVLHLDDYAELVDAIRELRDARKESALGDSEEQAVQPAG